MEKNYIKNKITGEQIINPLDFDVAENDYPKYISWNNAVKLANQMGEDWRLPTLTEIELLKEFKGVFGLDKRGYWTNETIESLAYCKSFKWYLTSRFVIKHSTCGVRFVRATTMQAQTTPLPDKPEVVLVQGGTFTMGSTIGKDETPHSVTLSSYSIGKYPVTVGEYKKYCTATGTDMPEEPNWGWNDKHPIVNVNYYEAVAYCNWLGETYGGDWRLPTEAQWEFAARGGNKRGSYTYSGSDDLDEVSWYADNAGGKTQTVGRKKANELGIYDMSGNVREWCKDWYGGDYSTSAQTNPKGASSGSSRVLRGGSWYDSAALCRVANRNYLAPSYRIVSRGFRVVLSQ